MQNEWQRDGMHGSVEWSRVSRLGQLRLEQLPQTAETSSVDFRASRFASVNTSGLQ